MQPGRETVTLRGEEGLPPLGVLICYEIIFPEMARAAVAGGAEILLNLTNDAWFGATSAPHQHFAEVVLRSVETGRYIVRAANTGISGIIDPLGRVRARSRLGEMTFLTSSVSPIRARTAYAQVGDLFAWACVMMSVIGLLMPPTRSAGSPNAAAAHPSRTG